MSIVEDDEQVTFSLSALIDEVRESAGPDPADIAAKVEPLIPESERHAVFVMLLTRYISTSKPRIAQVIAHPQAKPTKGAAASPPRPAKSAKVAAYREYGQFLRIQVAVGKNEYRWMGDCSYDDLIAAAERRRTHAAQTIAAAEQYEAIAELVRQNNVPTVSKLPLAVLREFLGPVAA